MGTLPNGRVSTATCTLVRAAGPPSLGCGHRLDGAEMGAVDLSRAGRNL